MKKLNTKGITLIALVITIIVLLILAAVSIATLTGDNGILTKAQEASAMTKEATLREQLEVETIGSFDSNGKFNTETFRKRVEGIGGKVLSEDEDEIVVELDGYEAVIDAKTGEIKSFDKGGVTPVVKATVGDYDGTSKNVKITVEVTNDVGNVDSVTVTNLDTGKTYPATFSGKSGTVEVDSNGTYKIEVEATTDGSQRTGQATVTVDKIEVAFTKSCAGKIDVIWVNTKNEKIDEPLAPVLNGMKKVYWEDNGTEKKENDEGFDNSKWYDYIAGDNNTDSKNSHWANAINTTEGGDGYFVWIPRYAYKITYLTTDGKVAGYCDGRGIINTKGELVNKGEGPKAEIETVEYNGFKYIVHPAFEGNVANGGWNSDLQGIWVGKYESSKGTSSSTSNGQNIKIVPNVSSWRSITIGNCYTYSKAYDDKKKSHLMKNSEWGAVAYLTHSQYGRNGHEITINDNNSYYTGGGQDDAYKTKTNQSSTGNIYGIYDLSGGAWEYVAAFNNTGSSLSNGSSFTGTTDKVSDSDEYATKYTSESSTPSYNSYIPGDATYEVFTGSGTKAWFDDYSYFVFPPGPFFIRGGSYSNGAGAGVFCAGYGHGTSYDDLSFRVVLAGC